MMVAIKATSEKEFNSICKMHKIKMWSSTISWYLMTWKSTNYYLCISVDEEGRQQGGGHVCTKHELGSTFVLTLNDGEEML